MNSFVFFGFWFLHINPTSFNVHNYFNGLYIYSNPKINDRKEYQGKIKRSCDGRYDMCCCLFLFLLSRDHAILLILYVSIFTFGAQEKHNHWIIGGDTYERDTFVHMYICIYIFFFLIYSYYLYRLCNNESGESDFSALLLLFRHMLSTLWTWTARKCEYVWMRECELTIVFIVQVCSFFFFLNNNNHSQCCF